jgi:hypothetical protein
MASVPVKVRRLHPDALMPRYAHSGTQGDLAADVFCIEPLSIRPGEVRPARIGPLQPNPPTTFVSGFQAHRGARRARMRSGLENHTASRAYYFRDLALEHLI